MSPETRPNLVLVITDQHRADHTGSGSNPVVRTPHTLAQRRQGASGHRRGGRRDDASFVVGHGAKVITEGWDQNRRYDRISSWGHQPLRQG